jgi:hypothetical protein
MKIRTMYGKNHLNPFLGFEIGGGRGRWVPGEAFSTIAKVQISLTFHLCRRCFMVTFNFGTYVCD